MIRVNRLPALVLQLSVPLFAASCASNAAAPVPMGATDGAASTTGASTQESETRAATSTGSGGPLDGTTGDGTTGDSTTGDETTGDGTTGDGQLPPFDPLCGPAPDPTGGSGGGEGQPNGGSCLEDEQCASAHCFVINNLVGGLCGECTSDVDCPNGGCTPPSAASENFSVCNVGEQQAPCESDDACCGIGVCAAAINIPFESNSTCGQCADDSDCPSPGLCQPNLATGGIFGVNECVLAGSLANGHACAPELSGDDACESGHCVDVEALGSVIVGVCSECSTTQDCAGGTCTVPTLEPPATLVPAVCE